jgi:V/A-type H+-transporting ATPase subunit F
MKYLTIGDEDTVLGFALAGVPGLVVQTVEEAQRAFDDALENHEIGIIIITERIADMIRSVVDRYLFTVSFPLIVEIPDRNGHPPGRPGIQEMVNAAIGIRL